MPGLSELEGTVLGVIGREGSCTAYALRREFAGSRTARWRASAGAIYPLVVRLEAAGLIASRASEGDRRGTRRLSLTNKGAKALAAWMAAATPELASAPADPIRTRVHFLARIDAARRAAVVRGWIDQTEREIDAIDADERVHDPFARLALEGARDQLVARRDWLRSVLDRVAPAAGDT
jgi:DNA-binding PadR family transcriptional regulator